MTLIFVDCEAFGGCPGTGRLTWFGAVTQSRETFSGLIIKSRADPKNPTQSETVKLNDNEYYNLSKPIFLEFEAWLTQIRGNGGVSMISDNPAYDFMWIADGFWRAIGRNPFGHSARRIGDFYAGLTNDFRSTQKWKRLRITRHDHNPVNDAIGNLEAFERILGGER